MNERQDPELREWEHNNRSRQAQVKFSPTDAGYGPQTCAIDICGREMPVQRREWGFKLCVECQSALER